MGFFDSILDNTVGRIPSVGGSISGIGKSIMNPVEGLLSSGMKMANTMTGVMTGLVDTLASPTFMYLVIGGLGLGAIYILTKSDGSSKNVSSRSSSSYVSSISALAKLSPQGRIAGMASAFI